MSQPQYTDLLFRWLNSLSAGSEFMKQKIFIIISIAFLALPILFSPLPVTYAAAGAVSITSDTAVFLSDPGITLILASGS